MSEQMKSGLKAAAVLLALALLGHGGRAAAHEKEAPRHRAYGQKVTYEGLPNKDEAAALADALYKLPDVENVAVSDASVKVSWVTRARAVRWNGKNYYPKY
jgi:hypothetical protein